MAVGVGDGVMVAVGDGVMVAVGDGAMVGVSVGIGVVVGARAGANGVAHPRRRPAARTRTSPVKLREHGCKAGVGRPPVALIQPVKMRFFLRMKTPHREIPAYYIIF